MQRLRQRTAIPEYSFHAISHFAATHHLSDVMKLPAGVLNGILGRKNKRTTEIYPHSVDEARRPAPQQLGGVFKGTREGRF